MNNLTKSEMCKKSFFYNGCKSGYYFDLDYNIFEIENNNEIIFKCYFDIDGYECFPMIYLNSRNTAFNLEILT